MKVAIAQLNYHIGNFEQNTDKIVSKIKEAKKENADLVVFSELSVCGYPPFDLLERRSFIEKTIQAVNTIAKECNGIAAIVGAPSLNKGNGKNLFNSAYFLENGEIKSITNKTLLPDYDIFDEYRYFQQNEEFNIIEFKGHRIALSICEDLWQEQPVDNSFDKTSLYKIIPMEELKKLNPDLMINIAASPFAHSKNKIRTEVLAQACKKYNLPLIYVNQVGAHTDLIFDGNSMLINRDGAIVKQLEELKEDIQYICTEEINKLNTVANREDNYIARIHDALVLGIKDYFGKTGFKTATLGLSGGIDSAVVVALAAEALGSENIRVLMLPSQFSSDHSIKDAVDLAENLNINYDIVPIKGIYDNYEKSLKEIFAGTEFNVAEENIQARVRGTLLMAISNKFGHILFNTTNKSEAAVGYGTLYGDMNGGLSVLGDVYKTDVFKLSRFINKDREIIPINTIVKPPSAELRPDQKDEDSLPPYDILDNILKLYIEQQFSKEDIIAKGYAAETVNRVIWLVNSNEYKRFQMAPVLRVCTKAFGTGRKIPLVARY
ncbi:MAG: NAD+ synthase [Marinifilaceae bacterium]